MRNIRVRGKIVGTEEILGVTVTPHLSEAGEGPQPEPGALHRTSAVWIGGWGARSNTSSPRERQLERDCSIQREKTLEDSLVGASLQLSVEEGCMATGTGGWRNTQEQSDHQWTARVTGQVQEWNPGQKQVAKDLGGVHPGTMNLLGMGQHQESGWGIVSTPPHPDIIHREDTRLERA